MSKQVNYPHSIGVKISDEQKRKIELSGMNTTDFVRAAIDFYDGARLTSYTAMKMNVINDCIGALNIFRENVKNSDENTFNLLHENVKSGKHDGENTFNNNTHMLNFSEPKVKPIETVKPNGLNLSEENVKPNVKAEEEKKLQETWEQVKITLRKMTTSKGRPSQRDFQRQAKKCGKTTKELENYYQKHINYFMQDVATVK